MNPTIELDFWLRLLGILALEIGLVVALAFVAQTLTQSAFWRRAIWQSCFVCLLLLVASEFSGAGRGIAVWFAGKPVVERKVSVRILSADESFVPAPIETEIPPPMEFSEKPAPVVRSVWWPGILWLAGFALIVARILFARILFLTLRWRKREITDATLRNRVSELALHLGIRRNIRLLESPGFSSPMTFGIAQPCIALPKNFADNFNSAEQNAMLTHELAHVAARDPFWYLLADVASALLWWHPVVWFARRRLHSASELAADEAAAILENGPGTLAECLVNLGQRMTQSRSFGWLGVDGNGFRSHLGQRVERLLNLKPTKKNKLRGWPLFLAKTAFTIFFGGLIVFTSGWIQNGKAPREKDFTLAVQKSWNRSFASMTLAALEVERTKLLAKNEIQATTKKAEEASPYDELTFETLIYNDFSPEQLKEVERILEPSSVHSSNQTGDVLTVSSNDLQNILVALSKFKDQMTMPWDCGRFIAPFDMVGTKSSGVQIIYQGNPTNSGNSCNYLTENKNGFRTVTGVEMSYQASHEWSFSVTPQKRSGATEVNLEWKNRGNEMAKKFVMPVVGGAIVRRRFSDNPARNQLVIFSSQRLPRVKEKESDPELTTRVFKVDPHVFEENLRELIQIGGNPTGDHLSSTNQTHQAEINLKIREYFQRAGVKFGKPGDTTGKAVFFNERTGLLMVRATLKDCEILESAIEVLNEPPSDAPLKGQSEPQSKRADTKPISPEAPPASISPEKPAARTNPVYTSRSRQMIKAKLDRIRLKEVQFEDLPLGEVLKMLRTESKEQDPEHVGINFLFNPQPVGLSEPVDVNQIRIGINLPMKNFRLTDILDVLVQVANKPIEYKIEDYAVVFFPKTAEAGLHTKIFKLYASSFLNGLKRSFPDEAASIDAELNQLGKDLDAFAIPRVTDPQIGNPLAPRKSQQVINPLIQKFFTEAGIDFGKGPPENPEPNGKAVFFNERTGLLMVRATLEDLEKIRKAVEPFAAEPPQVTVETKFAEVDEAAARKIDWNELLNTSNARIITNSESGFDLLDGLTNWPKAFPDQSLSNSIARNFTTVLTDVQFRTVLRQMEQQAGADILTPPNVTTLSGRQTQISIENPVKIRPASGGPEITLETGPVLDVEPTVAADGFLIRIPITATIKEIDQKNAPVAKIRQMSATCIIYDGQTFVMGEVTSNQNAGNKKRLFVFVTVTIIDPAGNRVHSDEDLPFAADSVPKQPGEQ